MAFVRNERGGVVFYTSDLLHYKHAFLTRLGGVSRGTFSGLNLSATCGDEPEHVRENYRRVGAALGIDSFGMVFTRQVHGTEVRLVTESDRHTLFTPVPYEADGLVTTAPRLPILVMTADCAPVLLEDTDAHVAAAVHCGWRGTVLDILNVAVGKMADLGASPAKIRAAVGPSIGRCCFETGPEVPEGVRELLGSAAEGYIRPEDGVPGKSMVDLRGACRERLLQLGIPYNNIDVSDLCTVCMCDSFWSHRATGGKRGIQANIIVPD